MRRDSSTLPTRFGNGIAPSISSPRLVNRWQFKAVKSPSSDWSPQADSDEDCKMVAAAPALHKVRMLSSRHGAHLPTRLWKFVDAGAPPGDAQLRDRSPYSLASAQADCHS